MAMGIKAWFTTNYEKITGTLIGSKYALDVNEVNSNLPMLQYDETAATSDTNVVTLTQAGIQYAELYNPHETVIMYVNFGADPAAGSQIVLNPKCGWDGAVDNKSSMRYKSSANGGKLDYVLRG